MEQSARLAHSARFHNAANPSAVVAGQASIPVPLFPACPERLREGVKLLVGLLAVKRSPSSGAPRDANRVIDYIVTKNRIIAVILRVFAI
jgi:hypothetical protein